MYILFVASDNSASSGAFLSMTILNKILNQKYGIKTLVVLPCRGDGKQLLDNYNIQSKIIYSGNWCVPLNRQHSIKLALKKMFKIIINFFAIIQLSFIAKKEKIDIIHVNTSYSYVGAVAANLCGIPLVWHLREFLEEDQGYTIWNKDKGYSLIEKANKIIAISNSIYHKYEKIFPSDKLCTIYNGIDKDTFYFPAKQIFNKAKTIIAIIGGISPGKGQIELVEAISRLKRDDIEQLEVWIIGKGNLENERKLRSVIFDKKLQNVILLKGYQKDISKWLQKIDIVVICSKAEAFGRVTVEAMLAGCLVIGADTAGTKELIVNNETGLLYRAGDVKSLSDAISNVINIKSCMKAIALAGQRYMLKNMTADINAEKIVVLYKEVMEGKK